MLRDGMVPWPDHLADLYVAGGYWRERPLGWWLWQWADTFGDRVALVDGPRRLTYAQLAHAADAVAEGLCDLGLGNGDNIVVQLPNGEDFVVLALACFRLGVAPVMALPQHRQHELTYLARHVQAAAIVTPRVWREFDHEGLAHQIRRDCPWLRQVVVAPAGVVSGSVALDALRAWPTDPSRRVRLDALEPDPRDAALFLLSGGTTDLPKVVARTHNDLEYIARRAGEVCGYDTDTVYLVALPAAHGFPFAYPGILGTLQVGGKVVLLPAADPASVFHTIATERVTATAAVPALVQDWLNHPAVGEYDLSSLRVLQVGGARLAEPVAAQIGPVLGCQLVQAFGMSEGLLNLTRLDDKAEVVMATQGRPVSPADEIRIVAPDGTPVPPGGSGELQTRGPYTPNGYFRAPHHNLDSFTADGWYRTGDLVRMHPSGNLVVEGRAKDVINRGGEKISAEEIEATMLALPQVAQAAAIAVPDPRLGERVCVCVVLHPGQDITLRQITAEFAARAMAIYKVPEQLEVLADMPLTNIGKIDKKALRQLIAERYRQPRPVVPTA